MPPKKAAKKSAKHQDDKHHHAKDLRRAYEHLGRVEILRHVLSGHGDDIAMLVDLAQRQIASGGVKNAADMLRAAEHLGFAAILNRAPGKTEVFGDLMTAVDEEFERLEAKARDHWEAASPDPAMSRIFEDSLKMAVIARDHGAYRQALELVRAAEALAHVKNGKQKPGPKRVAASSNVRELAAS